MLRKNVNWAGNLAFSTERVHAPQSVGEVQDVVRKATKAHAVGSRHSFSPIADTDGAQISLRRLNRILAIDKSARTINVEGGITYAELGPELHRAGFALHNLASLPNISVAGAVATGTHGSGTTNLSAAVRGVKLVTAGGEVAEFRRGDPEFDGVVVSLGGLGVVVELSLDLEPSFEVVQDTYLDLPFDTLAANFEDIMGSGYSVSPFHSWSGDSIPKILVKSLATAPRRDGGFFGARTALPSLPTPLDGDFPGQASTPVPWHQGLPHFQSEMVPATGAELQAEYFVPQDQASAALRAVRSVQHHLEKVLIVSEIRTLTADTMWLSPAFERACLAIHFTCHPDLPALKVALPAIEVALKPFDPRPHWAKVFTMSAEDIERSYPQLPQFRALRKKLDPRGKFGNDFIDEFVG